MLLLDEGIKRDKILDIVGDFSSLQKQKRKKVSTSRPNLK
jgi:hypothetical protein